MVIPVTPEAMVSSVTCWPQPFSVTVRGSFSSRLPLSVIVAAMLKLPGDSWTMPPPSACAASIAAWICTWSAVPSHT
jgi:hypothetical protein